MIIQLPEDLAGPVDAAVRSGRFGSPEELIAQAVRLLLHLPPTRPIEPGPDPFLGSMRDAADELDTIVADVYRRREEETWRGVNVE